MGYLLLGFLLGIIGTAVICWAMHRVRDDRADDEFQRRTHRNQWQVEPPPRIEHPITLRSPVWHKWDECSRDAVACGACQVDGCEFRRSA